MTTFHLQIATMDGNVFDGQVQSVSCRTIHGDLAILARHMNYCTAIGMGTAHVVLEDGTEFGTLKDVMETGANDVYIINSKEHGEVLLPAIKECILNVDLESNTMTIHLMKGLI